MEPKTVQVKELDKAAVVGGMQILAAVQRAVRVVVKVEVRAKEQAGKASYDHGN